MYWLKLILHEKVVMPFEFRLWLLFGCEPMLHITAVAREYVPQGHRRLGDP